MKSLMISLASLILLTACVEQEGKTAAPGATDARGAYANALAGEGRSAVVFDNGDVILADSARLIVEKAAARLSTHRLRSDRRNRRPYGHGPGRRLLHRPRARRSRRLRPRKL